MATEKRLIDAIKHRLECHIAKAIHWGVDNIPMGKDSSSAFEFLRGYERGATETANIVLSMIPVDAVEVVHGRWIEKQEPIPWCEDDVDVFSVCSVCDCCSLDESNYCPNCGAKMDGDGNGQ